MFRYELLNSSSVRLKWNIRVNQAIPDRFDLVYGPVPDTQVFNVSQLDGSTRDYIIHQLQPDTKYGFELRPHLAGRLLRPEMLLVSTPSLNQLPLKPDFEIVPLAVKAEPRPNNTIQLTWQEHERPSQFRNSARVNIIRYYATNYQQQAVTSNTSTSSGETSSLPVTPTAPTPPRYHYLNVTNASERGVLIPRLKPGTEYAFAVKTIYYSPDMRRIFTQSGFSMDTLVKTLDIEPSAPRNFTIQFESAASDRDNPLAGELRLTWSPPEFSNGQLKGYVILYSQEVNVADDLWDRIEVNTTTQNYWYVRNLKPGSRFYFKMRAINQRGQSPDSETRIYVAPAPLPAKVADQPQPVPANNVLLLVAICMIAIIFLLFLVVSRLACRTRKKPRTKANQKGTKSDLSSSSGGAPKLDGYATTQSSNGILGSSSTVAARVGTLSRRRENPSSKPDFWISALDQGADSKSNISEKSITDMNMALVSIRQNSPQFATTQLAPALPDYRFVSGQQQAELMNQSHYHPGHFGGTLAYDRMDNATANALMTLSKRQQQQLQKYQIQFATTGAGSPVNNQPQQQQAPSPHQQPPPPPPLNIEQQQQQQQQQQSLYGTHQQLASTRSLRLHNRPTLYDPVSGSFLQSTPETGPPNYNTHSRHPLLTSNQMNQQQFGPQTLGPASNTLQFHPQHHHQASTLLSRRSTNTLRSFQNSAGQPNYGQLNSMTVTTLGNQLSQALSNQQQQQTQPQQPQQVLQSHQAVINQLNNSTYPSLPLKHVSAVRPQIMSSLEDQIEMELAEKEQQQQQQQQQHDQQQAIIKQ